MLVRTFSTSPPAPPPFLYRKVLEGQTLGKHIKRRLLVGLFSLSGLHPYTHCLSVGLLRYCFLLFPRDSGSRHCREQTLCIICLHWACSSPGAPSLRETQPRPQPPKEKSGHWPLLPPHMSSSGPVHPQHTTRVHQPLTTLIPGAIA